MTQGDGAAVKRSSARAPGRLNQLTLMPLVGAARSCTHETMPLFKLRSPWHLCRNYSAQRETRSNIRALGPWCRSSIHHPTGSHRAFCKTLSDWFLTARCSENGSSRDNAARATHSCSRLAAKIDGAPILAAASRMVALHRDNTELAALAGQPIPECQAYRIVSAAECVVVAGLASDSSRTFRHGHRSVRGRNAGPAVNRKSIRDILPKQHWVNEPSRSGSAAGQPGAGPLKRPLGLECSAASRRIHLCVAPAAESG